MAFLVFSFRYVVFVLGVNVGVFVSLVDVVIIVVEGVEFELS